MDLNQKILFLVALQKDQTTLIYSLWSVFQGLSFILIGFVFSQEYVRTNPWILSGFSVSILLFSVGNHSAIMRAQSLVAEATKTLKGLANTAPELGNVLGAFDAPDSNALGWFHIAFALFAAIGVWVPYIVKAIKG